MGASQPKVRVIVRPVAPSERDRGRFPWAAMLLFLLLTGSVAGLFGWERSMASAVYPGVRIAGVDIGGLTLFDARARLASLQRAALDRAITVTAGPLRWRVTPDRLGLRLNLEDRLREAYALGREADPVARYSTQADLLLHGHRISLVGNYDTDALQAFVQQAAVATYQAPQPAAVVLQDGRALVRPDARDGRTLDKAAATSLLLGALQNPGITSVDLPVRTSAAPVSEAAARREVASLQGILNAQLHLRFRGQHWLLGPGLIVPAISLTTVTGSDGSAVYQHSVSRDVLQPFVDGIGGQVDRPARTASVVIQDGAVQVIPAITGYHLDRPTTLQVLASAILAGGTQDIRLPVGVKEPQTPTVVAQATARQVAALIRRPLALHFGNRQWLLDPSQLGSLLDFAPRQDPLTGPQLDFHINPDRLARALAPVMAAVGLAPVDARFVVRGNAVSVVPSTPGRQIDVAALAPLIEHWTRGAAIQVPTVPLDAALTTEKAKAMGIDALYFQHSTYFPGSSAARLTNIHAAVRHLQDQLIAPDEVFSFNARIGDITTAGGYVQGINIVDNQDVPGIGGGVCQVAVTLFQGAIFSGMPILERIPHANIVSYYSPIGLDATVFVSPSGPDVKFRNNTGHWVLIDFVEDLAHDTLTARFFGTDPHYKVVVRGPFQTYHPGGIVDAVFYRTVYDAAGKVLLDAHFNSHYVPVTAR